MMKTLVLATALACCTQAQAQAQTTAPAAPPATASPASPASPAKKELIARVITAQQPALDQQIRQIVERPAAQMLRDAGIALQARVPADKREALLRDLQADARKYVDETYPIVRERAAKLAPTTIGPLLDEKMTEEELRQVLAVFESAAWRKFLTLGPDMHKVLGEKLMADVNAQIEPKVRALDQSMTKRLGITPPPAASAPSGPR